MHAGRIDVRRQDGAWLLILRGEHDITTQQMLRAQLHNLISTGVGVVIDLSEAEFIDSTVIATLIGGRDAAGSHTAGRLAIVVSGDGAVADRFVWLIGIDQVIPTFTSRHAAARSLTPIRQESG
jgi:anti-anti-sigma factor